MKFWEKVKVNFYLGRMKSMTTQVKSIQSNFASVREKLYNILSKYTEIKEEVRCKRCQNVYNLQQVECGITNTREIWYCPNCSCKQVIKLINT